MYKHSTFEVGKLNSDKVIFSWILDLLDIFFYVSWPRSFSNPHYDDISTRVSHDLHNYANYRSKNQEIDRLIKRGIIFVTVSL